VNDRLNRIATRWLLGAFLLPWAIFGILWLCFPLPVDKLNPPASTVVLDRDGRLLRAYLAPDDTWRIRVTGGEISPALKAAVLAYEDRSFYIHPGVNPKSILRAAVANLWARRIVQGGSTITMQVARLMEPKERTILGKLVEVFRALQLEVRYSKDQILTYYFNLAPYGGNLVGVGAASRFYFGKSPDCLSFGEAALLATIPNSPNRYRPDVSADEARRGRDKILQILKSQSRITGRQFAEAVAEPIPDRRFDLPFQTPHFADLLVRAHPHEKRLQSTIDPVIQRLAETSLHNHLRPLIPQGITNGAVVVIDNQTRELLALVGSYDFFDSLNHGQVNGAIAPRSPGSALKPFVYALGINDGLISPRSLLFDVPVEYSGYRPVNYDETYHGAVTAEDALIRSLNVPAVNLSARLGADGVYTLLKTAGISTLPQPQEYYGLSLVLGGCEVNLLELTNLYSGLANGGNFAPCKLLRSAADVGGKQLLSQGTCYVITDILSQLRRPELPAIWESTLQLPRVAWKTGTSYGKRDAWSIGYTPRFTVGVWVGNFDGKGNPRLVGAEVATPILFAIFDALESTSSNRWFIAPNSVARRQVCAISGLPPSEYCAVTADENYIPGTSPNQTCQMHELIMVDKLTGRRLCSHCRGTRIYTEKIIANWPVEITTWMQRNGYPIDPIPQHFDNCPQLASGQSPVIVSPSPDAEYILRSGVDPQYQKILLDASVSNKTRKIYWFLNKRLIYSGSPEQRVFISPTPGAHTLVCLDDEGRSAEVKLTVRNQ
jgi:penicillin-binding protein 1C